MDFMVRSSIEKKQVVPILVQWRPDPLEVYIAYPPSRRYSTKVRVFADWAASLFATA
jgi:DNA-binding transcriptional LysR family regulator